MFHSLKINKKTILICGFSRGGTNVLWNILQSHPDVCAPRHETGAIFRKKEHLKFSRFLSLMNRLSIVHQKPLLHIIDFQLFRYKMENYRSDSNKYKYEGVHYSRKEIAASRFCLKSVDMDIFHTDLLLKVYPDLFIIFIARNGYSLAESHMRRGDTITESAENYVTVGLEMERLMKKTTNSMFLTFEEIIEDPFLVSEKIFKSLNLHPQSLEKLRFKSKKVIKNNHLHESAFGEVDKKYWFGKDNIHLIIDKNVNKRQMSVLNEGQIKLYNQIAGTQLEKFGYTKLP